MLYSINLYIKNAMSYEILNYTSKAESIFLKLEFVSEKQSSYILMVLPIRARRRYLWEILDVINEIEIFTFWSMLTRVEIHQLGPVGTYIYQDWLLASFFMDTY